MDFSGKVTRAVKAEMARHGVTAKDLITVLQLGRNAIYARLRGEVPFNTDELEEITSFIGIDMDTIFKSAALDCVAESA